MTFGGLNIAEAAALTIDDLRRFFERVSADRSGTSSVFTDDTREGGSSGATRCSAWASATSRWTASRRRCRRARRSASGWRRLAGIGLRGVLYVLDEPSIGLHHHDTALLLDVLRAMRDRGNTVLVVEHDDQTILQADWIVDVGPGRRVRPAARSSSAGRRGRSSQTTRTGERAAPRREPHAGVPDRDASASPSRPGGATGTGTLAVDGRHAAQPARRRRRVQAGRPQRRDGVSGAGKSTLRRRDAAPARGGDRAARWPRAFALRTS